MRWRDWPWHVLAVAMYPALALYVHNLGQVQFADIIRSLVAFLSAGAIILVVLQRLQKDWRRAGLLASVGLGLFFFYGHIYNFFKADAGWGLVFGRHRTLVPIWIALSFVSVWWSTRSTRNVLALTGMMNLAGGILMGWFVLQIGLFEIRYVRAQNQAQEPLPITNGMHLSEDQIPPDIYYIILDAYPRADVLVDFYGYDNSEFLRALQTRGFYIAQWSQSNYAQTELSIASSLNYTYLTPEEGRFEANSVDRAPLWPLIRHSAARQALEGLGYTSIAFETGFNWTQWSDAGYYLTRDNTAVGGFGTGRGLNAFELLLLRSTAGLILFDAAIILPEVLIPDTDTPFENHRQRILFVLDQLKRVPEIDSPKLVFAHLVSPHSPIVFGPNGEFVSSNTAFTLADSSPETDPEGYVSGYRGQVQFLNGQILEIVDEIFRLSETPPVIILQADHGAALGGRMWILNALYLPEVNTDDLYPTLSPVNTFRIIFNTYFEVGLDALEDVSYLSSYQQPYEYKIVPNNYADP